jgi:hypothetical protein
MLSLSQLHFSETRRLVEKIDRDNLISWLLRDGYYPEQYVLPPCFTVEKFDIKDEPYYPVKNNKLHPKPADLLNISFPKSLLTDRIFGIIEPKIYHDIAWHLLNEFDFVLDHLFNPNTRFYCYSFPVPINRNIEGELGQLRSGRMIYEFIEMAENDLVADAHNYQYVVHTDIKNFYPSVYTHSLAWALHDKELARADKFVFDLLGSKLDKLFQNSNDGCTNGLAIGPVLSDLAAEILLAAVDQKCSQELEGIEFLGVRFKDDYRVLCKDRSDADKFIRILQRQMRYYNLFLNEGKTTIKELPDGLFRAWILEYQPFSLKGEKTISYKVFENTLLAVLEIDKKYPDTGIIDKFLGELVTKDYELKIILETKQILKALSLLFMLKKRRAKVFPQILAIIELLILKLGENAEIKQTILDDVTKHFRDSIDYLYDGLWIYYFLKSHGRDIPITTELDKNPLFRSIRTNKQEFFNGESDISLFKAIEISRNKSLAEHLAIYPKDGN